MEEKMKCMECGELVHPAERHTFEDCKIHKEKLKMVELSRLQEKVNTQTCRFG